jgi:hypothetical protein
MMNTLDPHLNVKAQARAVFTLLADQDPDFAEFKDGRYQVEFTTWAWYNGRERGICISMQRDLCSPCLHVAFGECRSSDDIFVSWWATNRPFFNGPTVKDCPERAYTTRRLFKYGACGEAAKYIYDLLGDAYADISALLLKETRAMDEVTAVPPPAEDSLEEDWDALQGPKEPVAAIKKPVGKIRLKKQPSPPDVSNMSGLIINR